jgi:hypothetical protein
MIESIMIALKTSSNFVSLSISSKFFKEYLARVER